LKLSGDGGKDEMTTCIFKDAQEASPCICSTSFDGGKIFIEFIIRLRNNASACFSLVHLAFSMGSTCICLFHDAACLGCEGSTIDCYGPKLGEKTFCFFETLLCIVEFFCEPFVVTVAMMEETGELSVGMTIDISIWRGQWGGGDMIGDHS